MKGLILSSDISCVGDFDLRIIEPLFDFRSSLRDIEEKVKCHQFEALFS